MCRFPNRGSYIHFCVSTRVVIENHKEYARFPGDWHRLTKEEIKMSAVCARIFEFLEKAGKNRVQVQSEIGITLNSTVSEVH